MPLAILKNVVFCFFLGDGPVMILFQCRILHHLHMYNSLHQKPKISRKM